MAIHILLAGEEIGPFSEMQVRQYIDEGLVTSSDLATCDGMEDWQPVDAVLANLPPTPCEAAPSEPARRETSSLPAVKAEPPPPSANGTGTLPTEPFLALAAAQRAKRTTRKIVIEQPRPTTALPPVASIVPKEKAATKPLPKLGQLSLLDVPGKIEAPASALIQASKEAPTAPPVSAPAAKEPAAAAPKAPVAATPDRLHEEPLFPRLFRWLFFACCGLAAVICLGILYFFYKASTPHDTGHHGVLLKSDATPPGQFSTATASSGTDIVNPKTAADFAGRGVTRKDAKDINGAMADFNQALNLDPNDALASYNRGLLRQQMGDLKGALDDFTTTIATDPKSSHAFNNRAYIKQTLGDLDGAIADYNETLNLDPTNAIAYYNVGLIRVKKGDLDGAVAAYNLALDNNPKMAIVYYNRGGVKNTEGDLEGAIADYTQAIVLDPKNALAFCDRGFARQTQGDVEGALSDYTEALALNDKLTLVYYNRSLIHVQQGDLDGAIDDSTHAIDLDPKNGQAYCNRGLARFGKGNYAGALDDLRKFCAISPRAPGADTARLYQWISAVRLNPHGTADQDLSIALQTDWNSPPEDFTSKIADFLLGHMHEGDLIANAASPDPTLEPGQYCKAWYFAGIKRRQAGEINTAINYFQKCVATNQTNFCEYIFAKGELQALSPNGANAVPKATAAAP